MVPAGRTLKGEVCADDKPKVHKNRDVRVGRFMHAK
jgi:hypothetical protein